MAVPARTARCPRRARRRRATAAAIAACSRATPGLIAIRSAPSNVDAEIGPVSQRHARQLARERRGVRRRRPRVGHAHRRAATGEKAGERQPGEPATQHDRTASLVSVHQRSFSVDRPASTSSMRDDPEADHDLVLLPALEFEVMVDRRHPEHPPAGELERRDLDHHRQRLDDEHAAHDEQHDLLPDDDGDRAQRGAQRERADIAHEHLGRIRVEPEETQARRRRSRRR